MKTRRARTDVAKSPRYSATRRKALVWTRRATAPWPAFAGPRRSVAGAQAVARAPDRVEEGFRKPLVDLLAKARNVDIDDIRLWIEMVIPDAFEKHRPSHHLSGVPHQVLE